MSKAPAALTTPEVELVIVAGGGALSTGRVPRCLRESMSQKSRRLGEYVHKHSPWILILEGWLKHRREREREKKKYGSEKKIF